MPSGDPELVLPVRFDLDGAIKAIVKLSQQGSKTGDDNAKAMGKGTVAAHGFANELANIGRRSSISRWSRTSPARCRRSSSCASDHAHQVAQEFVDLRQNMQQVAALTGKDNSNEFTLEQTQKAAAASLRPEEWTKFQELFQSYGGAYTEGDQNRFIERGGVSAEKQAEQYQAHIAEFAKARGIAPAEAAQLGGGLLQFSEGPQKLEDLEARFGKVFKTLERAPTLVSQLMPQMSRVMAQGASPRRGSQHAGDHVGGDAGGRGNGGYQRSQGDH